MRWRLKRQKQDHLEIDDEHNEVMRRLDEQDEKIVDFAVRLVRLEADVEIYRPFFVNKPNQTVRNGET